MILEFLDQKGQVVKINIKTLNILKRRIKPFGNSFHVLVKKEDVKDFDRRKPVGVLFFEWNGGSK
jgi:hypothetical protein